MNRPAKRRLAVIGAACAALALAGCATSRLVTKQSNPDYAGKPFKSVMVVAVTSDELLRRTFEDRIVALLGKRGVKGVPAYAAVGSRGRVEEAQDVFLAHVDAANHVGLLAEEIDPGTGALLGNFPQAFSHLGLINAALGIDRALRVADEAALGRAYDAEPE